VVRREKYSIFGREFNICSGNEETRDHLEYVEIDGRTILKLILEKDTSNKSPTRCKNFSSLLLDIYLQLNMFWESSCPSSGAQLQ
jgi:hypothetical protein